ncbi:MAG: hypothetical protein ACR2NN_23980 [Bryobacteraceae bacterium]
MSLNEESSCKLIISMQGGEKLSLEQIRAFLAATEEAQFDGQSTTEVYAWVTRVLQQHGYNKQKRP